MIWPSEAEVQAVAEKMAAGWRDVDAQHPDLKAGPVVAGLALLYMHVARLELLVAALLREREAEKETLQ